jgi:hypothetical protein
MDSGNAVCSCTPPHSVFDVAMHLEGLDFEAAKIRVVEAIGRADLIVDPNAEKPKAEGLSYGQIPAAVRTPYFRPDGEPSMRFRVALAGDKKKRHFWRKGDKACLYGARDAASLKEASYVVIVEGESDTQTLWYHGIAALAGC